MVTEAITYNFLDWARARIQNNLAGIIDADLIFDEREANIMQTIKEKIARGLGICVAISLPQLSQIGNLADDTQYTCSCCIGVIQNRALNNDLDGAAIAETLFRSFAGAEYQSNKMRPVDVKANMLSHSSIGSKKAHEFIIYTTITI